MATKAELLELLKEIQKKHLRLPDSDAREYCSGCGNSPYNVPDHKEGCLALKLWELFRNTKKV